MDKLRILGLDDDNHAPCFYCENGTRFETYQELIKFLGKPHDCQVDVRMFAIVNPLPLCGLADYEQEEIDDMFYYLEGSCGLHPPVVHPDYVFELFWNAANRHCW